MERKIEGIISLIVLIFLAGLAIILVVAFSWAIESRAQGKFLEDYQRIISSLDVGMSNARKNFPQPSFFDVEIQGIRIYTGEFFVSPTNSISENIPGLATFSYEGTKIMILETAITAESKISTRGTIRRTKIAFHQVLIPK